MDKPWACIFFTILGILILKVYFNRDKNNIWGKFYHRNLWPSEEKDPYNIVVRIPWLVVGWVCLIGGLTCFFGP